MYLEPVYATEAEVNGLIDKYIEGYKKDDYYRWAIVLLNIKGGISWISCKSIKRSGNGLNMHQA
jgi:hypothetical protein